MRLSQLFATLRDLNVHLYVQEGNLKCKAPKDVLNEELKSQLKSRKAELIEALSQVGQEFIAITPYERIEPIPLSYAQQRLWFLDQLEPNSSLYNMPYAFSLTGHLNEAALSQSFNEIMRRHENLRTVFVAANAVPAQIIASEFELPIANVDLSGISPDVRGTILRTLCRQEAVKPFLLTEGPLIRITLMLLSDDVGRQENILLVSLHHIVSDGWSSTLLMREFTSLYQKYNQGERSSLAELPIQYADYAWWQRYKFADDVLQQQIDYWRNKLDAVPGLLELPADRPRPVVMSYSGAQHHFEIPTALAAQIHHLSRLYNATLFMLLLTVFKVLLFRYSHQQDICVGTPIANRNRLEIEGLIGFFVNTLVLRTDLSGNPQFNDLLNQVRNTVLDAQSHQDLPFEQLVEVLQPRRNLSYSPLFQAMFVLQNKAGYSLQLPELQIGAIDDESKISKFDLTLHIYEGQGGLTGSLEYSTELFEEATIMRMAEHYVTLLQGVVDAPQTRLSELPMLTLEQRRQMLIDWNATQAAYPTERCVHQLFEAQVEKTPDQIALVFENQSLSYAELNAKANQLAHYLSGHGVGPEVLVGICIERSIAMVIALLGVLKAGGAYVPLPPDFPEQRLAHIASHCQLNVLLTQRNLMDRLLRDVKEIICLDSNCTELETQSEANFDLDFPVHCSSAYVIFTSGSTGLPKGVQVSHQNLSNFLFSMQDKFRLTAQDHVLAITSLSFDIFGLELYLPLMSGATVVLVDRDTSRDGFKLASVIRDREITFIQATPATWRLMENIEFSAQSKLTLLSGGEALTTDLAKQLLLKGKEVWNLYGPTETTVWSTMSKVIIAGGKNIAIGCPIENTRIYLLDKYLNPVPVAVSGEVYIAGNGVARGYFNQSDLTADRFIPDPFDGSGGRLYKTGDLAYYRPDGNIEFVGRVDYQVKIRGFRIELGEIEKQLLKHPEVKGVVVLVHENEYSGKHLIAYVVMQTTNTSAVGNLDEFIRKKLPDYMVPNAFVCIDKMPLTANGKIDRKALPKPNFTEQMNSGYVAPRNETEQVLAGIWASVLGMQGDQVGINDSFFELGGHSLLATQLLFEVRKKLNVKLMLKEFFSNPTIDYQARLILTGDKSGLFIDFDAESDLDSNIIPIASGPIETGKSTAIFLTGSTGFLGTFLLVELLNNTQADIYCLVRAANADDANNRLKEQLAKYELFDCVDFSRVIVVCGDLSKPQFGLSEQVYYDISTKVDVVYHNAALVNFILPYQSLKPANVLGTLEVLRLACIGKAKAIHYISTLSVFGGQAGQAAFSENDSPCISDIDGGYAQSKWVAEKLVRTASARGFQVNIYRSANISGDTKNGACNQDDFLCLLLKGCIQIEAVPETNSRIDISPVDYISKAIVALSLRPGSTGSIFHLNNPIPLYTQDLFKFFMASGYYLEVISNKGWINKILENSEHIEDFSLTPLLSMFSEQESTEQDENQEYEIRHDCEQTLRILTAMGIACPSISETLLELYRAYFMRIGFIPPPKLPRQITNCN